MRSGAAGSGGTRVIRQAISCDICGAEKKQTNHWFVAYEQGDELRVSGWNSRNRLRAGSKHLCGQACLHKLADDYMARVIAEKAGAARKEAATTIEATLVRSVNDTSLIADMEDIEFESSARLIPTPKPLLPMPAPRSQPDFKPQPESKPELVPMPARYRAEEIAGTLDEPPRFATRHWRAEAWEREREREQRAAEHRPENVTRRRFHA